MEKILQCISAVGQIICPPETSNIPGDQKQATLDASFAKYAHGKCERTEMGD